MSEGLNRQQRRRMERQFQKDLDKARTGKKLASAEQQREQSLLRRQVESRSPAQQEASFALLERLDGMAGLRNGLRKIAIRESEWAGIPMPMEGQRLVIDPRYPRAEILAADDPKEEPDPIASDPTFRLRNRFWSMNRRRNVTIWETNGKVDWGIDPPAANPLNLLLETLRSSDAWGIEQEKAAIDTLGSLIRHRQFKQYLLTTMFMERSKRSGVHYLFRRLRPTVAISERTGQLKILGTLCLHPIAYYEGSWAGAMTPTDDVVAHLMLMRGDEHMFWKRANQHPSWLPQAGIM